jgi:hypothetical protein
MLTTRADLPDDFLYASAGGLHQILPGPTLIHLPGRRTQPLFVSVLLHGNEDTGLKAVQSVLGNYRDRELPRALSLFIGNVQAAAQGQRHLESQPDYNRVWPGADSAELPEHAMMQEVVEQMRARRAFASIDIHNNTGINPHYGCVNRLEAPVLHLATLFSRVVVYFKRPLGCNRRRSRHSARPSRSNAASRATWEARHMLRPSSRLRSIWTISPSIPYRSMTSPSTTR